MQRVGIERDVFHSAAVDAARNLVGTREIPFEQQLAAACDQNRVHVGSAREPISHPTHCVAVDEVTVVDGADGPAVVSRDRKTAAVRLHGQSSERRQRSSAEKRNKLAPSHSILYRLRLLASAQTPTRSTIMVEGSMWTEKRICTSAAARV